MNKLLFLFGMEGTESFILLVLMIGAVVAIWYGMIRWAFSMKRQLWNQQQQITLLIKLCNKMGVSEDETSNIKERNEDKDNSKLW